METFSALLAHCAGNSPVTGEFPSQRSVTRSMEIQHSIDTPKTLCCHYVRVRAVTRSFDVCLIGAWTNGWANNRDTRYLRNHRAHYDVAVMSCSIITCGDSLLPINDWRGSRFNHGYRVSNWTFGFVIIEIPTRLCSCTILHMPELSCHLHDCVAFSLVIWYDDSTT